MNHTVYLPDELSERIKDVDLNLSRLFRDAVTEALEAQDRLAAAQDGMTEERIDIDTNTDDGTVQLRFTGKRIAGMDPDVYLTDEGKVVLVESYDTFDDVEDFVDWVTAPEERNNLGRESEQTVAAAAEALGGPRVVQL